MMGAFDRIAETAREARERIVDMKDRVIDTVKEATGQFKGQGEREPGRGKGEDLVQEARTRAGDAAQEVKDRVGGVVQDALVIGEKARQAIKGEPDALELIKRDHETAKGLFDQLEAMKDKSGELRESLFAQLKYELGTHATMEENIFYPAVRKASEGRQLVLEAFQEHRLMKQLLAELAGMPIGSPEWDAKLTVLKENVLHHVREEEDELFQVARQVLSKDQLQSMGARLEQEKQRLAAAGKPDESDDAAALSGATSQKGEQAKQGNGPGKQASESGKQSHEGKQASEGKQSHGGKQASESGKQSHEGKQASESGKQSHEPRNEGGGRRSS